MDVPGDGEVTGSEGVYPWVQGDEAVTVMYIEQLAGQWSDGDGDANWRHSHQDAATVKSAFPSIGMQTRETERSTTMREVRRTILVVVLAGTESWSGTHLEGRLWLFWAAVAHQS